MLEIVIQIIIAVSGGIAIWLTQQSNLSIRKYACLFGLFGQPFWVYTTYQAEQWGMLALTIVFIYSWSLGLVPLYRRWSSFHMGRWKNKK